MMDALGFKGIWARGKDRESTAKGVIEKLSKLQEKATAKLARHFPGQGDKANLLQTFAFIQSVEAVFVSDTVIVGFQFQDMTYLTDRLKSVDPRIDERVVRSLCIALSMHHIGPIIALGAKPPFPLAYRGCLSHGDFDIRKNFIIGPAVDEAGAMMNLAQGAFVWLTPSSLATFDPTNSMVDSITSSRVVSKWQVPLKGGDAIDTYAITPYALASDAKKRDEATKAILDSFIGGLDVVVKKQNTKRFLDHCVANWKPGRLQ